MVFSIRKAMLESHTFTQTVNSGVNSHMTSPMSSPSMGQINANPQQPLQCELTLFSDDKVILNRNVVIFTTFSITQDSHSLKFESLP